MDAAHFAESRRQQATAREAARCVLGVDRNAAPEEIKTAWRRACMRYHPDRNRDDEQAERRLILVNCAYHVLTGGDPCRHLLDLEPAQPTPPHHETYNLNNAWGHFLWSRDTFFG